MIDRERNSSLFTQPTAWIPLAMSLMALAFLLVYAAVFGTGYHAEERWPARLFQLVLLGEVPIAAFFAIKWLPKQPKQSLIVLAVQAIAWIIPVAMILLFENF